MAFVIGSCGFGGTGSSAVTDLLQEFDDNQVYGDFEFAIPHLPDGLLSLKHEISEGTIKQTSSVLALERFRRSAHGYPSRQINKLTGGRYKSYADDFIEAITQCCCYGEDMSRFYSRMTDRAYRGFRKLKISRFYRNIEERVGHDLGVFPYKKRRYSFYPANYDEEARRLIERTLTALGAEKGRNIVLDQPFPGNNPQSVFPFFNCPKAIVVDRDPRDYYLLAKTFFYKKGWRVIPEHSVKDFVVYYKGMREMMAYRNPHPDVLVINIEDLIYEYDRTVEKIVQFCHLGAHSRAKSCFDPEVSVNNTQLMRTYPEYRQDIEYIEAHLGEYLFPFEKYDLIPTDRTKMFLDHAPQK